jgi:hypothetical protein
MAKAEVVGSSVGDLARAAAQRDTPSYVIKELVDHEGKHASKDTEGHGVFGLLLTSGIQQLQMEIGGMIEVFEREIEVVVGAFYRWIGNRKPETLKEMAEAVGESDMSGQDRLVRDEAESEIRERDRREWFRESARSVITGTLKPGDRGTIMDRKQKHQNTLPLAA